MQYRCPKCQSPKIMPVAQAGEPAARPVVPKSLVMLIPAVFVVCVIAGFLFYRDLPDFKISMQAFMQSQKQWKCRECSHEWEV